LNQLVETVSKNHDSVDILFANGNFWLNGVDRSRSSATQ